MKCGKPLKYDWQEYCSDCAHTHHYYDRGRALWPHISLVTLSIYRFKFHNQRNFAKYYAAEAGKILEKTMKLWNPALIVPIPLHKAKRRKRGYNQAEVFANELGKVFGVPADGGVLVRVRNTAPQKKLDSGVRRRNLKRAFRVADKEKMSLVRGRTILLVDDIYTTGSTMDEAARVLKAAGAEKVYYLTISIGQGY